MRVTAFPPRTSASFCAAKIPLTGDSVSTTEGDNRSVRRLIWRFFMLQWKPRLIALLIVLALVAAVFGQLTWDALNQLTW
jgi:hypothetical protein